VVGLIDDDKVVNGVWATGSTESFEGGHIRVYPGGGKCAAPHWEQCRRRHDNRRAEPPRDSRGDESLSHPDFVTKERSAKLAQRSLETRDGGELVRVKGDFSELVVDPDVVQAEARYSVTDTRCCGQSQIWARQASNSSTSENRTS
jgi:hypothetical protein